MQTTRYTIAVTYGEVGMPGIGIGIASQPPITTSDTGAAGMAGNKRRRVRVRPACKHASRSRHLTSGRFHSSRYAVASKSERYTRHHENRARDR